MANYWTQKHFRERGVKSSNIPDLLAQGVPAEQLFITHKANNMATPKKTSKSKLVVPSKKVVKEAFITNLPVRVNGKTPKYPVYPLNFIKGPRIHLIVRFVDKGQDILWMRVEFYPGYTLGYVIDSSVQESVWTKYSVLNGKPLPGRRLQISEAPGHPVKTFKHTISKVESIAPDLFKVYVPDNDERALDYTDSVIVAAYFPEDVIDILLTEAGSLETLAHDSSTKFEKIGKAEVSVPIGVVIASYNAG